MSYLVKDASHNLPFLQDNLDSLIDKLGDLSPLMRDIAVILEESTTERFATKIAPNGTPWQDILPASKRAKLRSDGRMGGGGILVKTGALEDSIHSLSDAYSAHIGTDLTYGQYHQFGGRHLPKRPFLGVSLADEQTIMDKIEAYLNA